MLALAVYFILCFGWWLWWIVRVQQVCGTDFPHDSPVAAYRCQIARERCCPFLVASLAAQHKHATGMTSTTVVGVDAILVPGAAVEMLQRVRYIAWISSNVADSPDTTDVEGA